jgi:quercetin dioxygenase-like cupin family protein
MGDGTGPLTLGPGEGATIPGPAGGLLTFKVRGEQTNGTFTAFENVIAPKDGPVFHRHANEDESWYVLEGDLRFKLDGEMESAPAGSFVFVPRGVPHAFQNVGDEPARILVMFTPGWRGSSTSTPPSQKVPSTRPWCAASPPAWAWRCSGRRWPCRTRCSRRKADVDALVDVDDRWVLRKRHAAARLHERPRISAIGRMAP